MSQGMVKCELCLVLQTSKSGKPRQWSSVPLLKPTCWPCMDRLRGMGSDVSLLNLPAKGKGKGDRSGQDASQLPGSAGTAHRRTRSRRNNGGSGGGSRRLFGQVGNATGSPTRGVSSGGVDASAQPASPPTADAVQPAAADADADADLTRIKTERDKIDSALQSIHGVDNCIVAELRQELNKQRKALCIAITAKKSVDDQIAIHEERLERALERHAVVTGEVKACQDALDKAKLRCDGVSLEVRDIQQLLRGLQFQKDQAAPHVSAPAASPAQEVMASPNRLLSHVQLLDTEPRMKVTDKLLVQAISEGKIELEAVVAAFRQHTPLPAVRDGIDVMNQIPMLHKQAELREKVLVDRMADMEKMLEQYRAVSAHPARIDSPRPALRHPDTLSPPQDAQPDAPHVQPSCPVAQDTTASQESLPPTQAIQGADVPLAEDLEGRAIFGPMMKRFTEVELLAGLTRDGSLLAAFYQDGHPVPGEVLDHLLSTAIRLNSTALGIDAHIISAVAVAAAISQVQGQSLGTSQKATEPFARRRKHGTLEEDGFDYKTAAVIGHKRAVTDAKDESHYEAIRRARESALEDSRAKAAAASPLSTTQQASPGFGDDGSLPDPADGLTPKSALASLSPTVGPDHVENESVDAQTPTCGKCGRQVLFSTTCSFCAGSSEPNGTHAKAGEDPFEVSTGNPASSRSVPQLAACGTGGA